MTLAPRQKAFFLIALKERPQDLSQLIQFLPASDQPELQKLYQDLEKHDASSLKMVANSELRKFTKPQSQSYLSQVHNDWIVDLLSKESPEMVSTVLRYLPAERVQEVLEKLPHEMMATMPKLADTYAIPQVLVSLIKRRFENLFRIHKSYPKPDQIEFHHLCLFRPEQLEKIFMELGYREIALAMQSIPVATQTIVIGRLGPHDQKHVRYYMDKARSQTKTRIKQAQTHLVRQDIETKDSRLFVKELGFVIYAKAVLVEDLTDIGVIKFKLSRKEAKELMGIVNKELETNNEGSVLEYREDVISATRRVLS